MALPRRLVRFAPFRNTIIRRSSPPLPINQIRHNSAFKYTPPVAPSLSPATFSSSGLPQHAHPMPQDMPREDYSSPALYTFGVIGTIIKYIVVGGVLIGTVSLIGVEGAHQYVERVMLAVPAHLDFMDTLPTITTTTTSDTPGKQHRAYLTPEDEDFYAWAEENDSWTGGSQGGTSPSLGFSARHALRSAWICQTWGQGITGASIARDRMSDLAGGRTQVMKGMIGSAERARTDRAAAALNAGVNMVDPGYEIAEVYITKAITDAKKRGIVFPEELSVNRETYPSTLSSPVTEEPSSAAESLAPSRIAIDILLRHAEIYERIATPAALHKSQQLYERVLRSVLPNHITTTMTTTPFTSLKTDNNQQIPRQAFIDAVRESEVLRLAKKLGDVNARIGDDTAAHGWWTWGLERAGLDCASSSLAAMVVDHSSDTRGMKRVLEDAAKPGWFDGWFGNRSRVRQVQAQGVAGGSLKIPDLAPSQSMDKTLKANMTLVTTLPESTSPSSFATIPPPLQRSVISLLESYSTHLAITGDLSAAHLYQTIGLDIASAAMATTSLSRQSSAPAALHSLWLQQRAALLTLHKAEVEYATRAKGKEVTETLSLLGEANGRAEGVIKQLTNGPSFATTEAGADSMTRIAPSLDPHRGIMLKTLPLASTFNGPHATERAPAQQLLKDAQRTAAEGWNITGLLYESLARSQSKTQTATVSQSQELDELAMDSYERAMGWNKIAHGGQVTGQHDITDGEDVVGPANGLTTKAREYWSNYTRVKSRLGSGLEKVQGL
ncbi:hypothetical protein QFC22_002385 [Naganishia vaughanmartiniae]|uniref:Uncharacterized protein n=1 Tax=Naganishia vaughanmartiniae TaxID=1424756 RepID=A0ACC2XCJ1_9TREE|nr:hypothetical protein QFC22_002385 [Naganishia vaughanmartiniae]